MNALENFKFLPTSFSPFGLKPLPVNSSTASSRATERKSLLTWNIEVNITTPGLICTIEIYSGDSPEITIDWGDGTKECFLTLGKKIHYYPLTKIYLVKISGKFGSRGNILLGSEFSSAALIISTSAVPFIPGLSSFVNTFENVVNISSFFPNPLNLNVFPSDLYIYNPQASV